MNLTTTSVGDKTAPVCMELVIDPVVVADSVELASVQYSLDVGQNWIGVSLDSLPFTFATE